jgi:hypothetical protein
MNLILGSILLFILVIPGLVFRFSYLHGTYAKQSFKISAVDEIFWAILPALIFQFAGVILLEQVLYNPVRLDQLYALITNDSGSIDFDIVRKSLPRFLLYNLSLIAIAALLGLGTRFLVRKMKLDLKYSFLKINNEWYYLFSGEILDTELPGESKDIYFIQIDALVQTSNGTVVYCGTLEDYFLSKDNGLDRLYLSSVYRRKLEEDRSNDENAEGEYLEKYLDTRYYAMPGDLFVIPYERIINLNITYHKWSPVLSEEKSGDE